SESKLSKICQESFQMSPMQLFNTLRYQEAKRLLNETDLSIRQITTRLGFNDANYFTVFFKNFEGMSPLQMRKKIYSKKGNLSDIREDIRLHICHQMTQIINEVNRLTDIYDDLKQQLLSEDNEDTAESSSLKQLQVDSEYQQYMSSKSKTYSRNSYQIISSKIVSLLKESGIPLSTKQIFECLVQEHNVSITYTNLSNNILSRMNKDTNINVERVHRGYWQYRLKK
ncbi:AraC family transcriptional regulator, partial [Enterococcus faecalis]|nr:AraC family transcriptional regulator [Enterococcus faecalis]